MFFVHIRIASLRQFKWVPSTYHYFIEDRADMSKLFTSASWHSAMFNPQWLYLPMSRKEFYALAVLVIKVSLYIIKMLLACNEIFGSDNKEHVTNEKKSNVTILRHKQHREQYMITSSVESFEHSFPTLLHGLETKQYKYRVIHHLFITLLLGSKAKTVLAIKQLYCIQTKMYKLNRKMTNHKWSFSI